jgi:hypothetical protein
MITVGKVQSVAGDEVEVAISATVDGPQLSIIHAGRRFDLNPAGIGEFAALVEAARKDALRLWMDTRK